MPRPIRVLVLVFMLLAAPAQAGPWPREVKGAFLSFSGERDHQGNRHFGLWGEYGLRPRLTLGLDLGHSRGETSALIWLQRTLDDGQGPDRWSVSSGFGAVERKGELMALAQAGVGWGRGFEVLPLLHRVPGGGWLAVEARYRVAGPARDEARLAALAAEGAGLLSYLTPETSAKAEITLGWHARETLMLIKQLRFEDRKDTGFSSKLSLSAVRKLAGPVRLELGLVEPLSGPGERAVKIGTWLEF